MEGICFIVGAGHVDDVILEPSDKDFVIAADAGYQHMSRLSVVPDLVVGDFDSLPQKPNHPNVMIFPKEKDQTDMMLAIDEGLRRHFKKIIILGGLGGRLDHTFANIQALAYIAQHNAQGYLLDDGTAVTVIKNGSINFDDAKSGVVSIFSCGGSARGVTLRGLKYPLVNAVLEAYNPLGVSNEFTGVKSEISVSHGMLAVIWNEYADDFIDNLKETS